TGRHPSPASTERRKLRLCPFICYRYGSTRGQKMESMKFRQWVGRVAFVSIAWLALPIQSAVQAADFLDPEDAFRFSATVGEDGRSVAARFSIADGLLSLSRALRVRRQRWCTA